MIHTFYLFNFPDDAVKLADIIHLDNEMRGGNRIFPPHIHAFDIDVLRRNGFREVF